MTLAEAAVRAAIGRRGPLPFADVVELALYDPEGGFYATVGQAGRRGDFLTSPEVGPLFGAVLAGAIDTWWVEAGEPDEWTVVEVGAGPGTLARSVLAAAPACRGALRYVLVERSAAQRVHHGRGLSIGAASGPTVATLEALPSPDGPCIVVANELLDNLPFGLLERTATGWAEVHVDIDAGDLVEVLLPCDGPDVDAAVGARVPRQHAAATWVRDAVALAGPGGRVLAFDYATTTAAAAARPWTDWVRTYRRHQRGGPPLAGLGTQDITCEVAVDQLPAAAADVPQAQWLRAHGIDDLVDAARGVWAERAAIGDLTALRARSRVSEADALLDPAGLGAFRVLEWPG